jgi:hypothetical protein
MILADRFYNEDGNFHLAPAIGRGFGMVMRPQGRKPRA